MNKPEKKIECNGCEHEEDMKKYGKGMYHCRNCGDKYETDFYNEVHSAWESYHEAILCEKDKEIEKVKKNSFENMEIMSKATELISTKLDNKNTDYTELKGCYDMDTAILHKELFELREEIKLLNTLWELFEKFKNMDWDCFYRVDFYGCYYYWNSGNNKSQEFTGKTLVEALNKMWDSYNIDYPCPLTLKN